MITLSWPEHNKVFVEGLWNMFNEKYKVDLEIVIDNHVSKIHQLVLALFCPSFKNHFHLLGECIIKLDNATNCGEDIDLLVEFLYKGKICVTEEKLNNLLLAAESLGVQGLVEAINRVKSARVENKGSEEASHIKKTTDDNKTITRKSSLSDAVNDKTSKISEKELTVLPKKSKSKILKRNKVIKTHIHVNCDTQPLKLCPQCPYRHRCEVLYNKHLLRHNVSTDRSFLCNICNKAFRSRVGLRQHSLYHGDPKHLFSCPQCTFKTSQRPHWVRHLAVTHKIDPEGRTLTEDVKCELCSFVTTSQALLKNHHTQKHSTDKPYKCNECNYASLRKWDVVKHIRIVHRNERPFMCELCGYTSKTNGNLKNHVNRHLGLKPYRCNVCEQDFATVSSYKMHSRIHAVGEKPFVCQLCGHGFLRRYRLTTHMKQVHQIEVVVNNGLNGQRSSAPLPTEEHLNSDSPLDCLLPPDEVTREACIVMQLG